jgi:hypothetical protein
LKDRKSSRIFSTFLIDPGQGGVEELLGSFDVLNPGPKLLGNLEPQEKDRGLDYDSLT